MWPASRRLPLAASSRLYSASRPGCSCAAHHHPTSTRAREDLVADGVLRHVLAGCAHDARQVMAEYQGKGIAYDELDLGVANLDVEGIHAGSLDRDHDIVVLRHRGCDLANRDLFLLAILLYV